MSMLGLCSDEELSESDEFISRKTQLKPSRCMHFFRFFGQFTQMNPKVVEKAILLLKKKENKEQSVDEKEQLNNRILKIETTLETIVDKLNELLKK